MFYHTFWSNPILYNGAACILTVIIEVCWFRVFGYKRPLDLGIIALSNVVTNVALNTFLDLVPDAFDVPWLIILELLVVAAEYLIYRKASDRPAGSLSLRSSPTCCRSSSARWSTTSSDSHSFLCRGCRFFQLKDRLCFDLSH